MKDEFVKELPKMSKNRPKCRKIAQNAEKSPKMSKNHPKCSPIPNLKFTFSAEKTDGQIIWPTSIIYCPRKTIGHWRKLAQSGHPDRRVDNN
jgi:hypothetical protein